MKQQHAMKILLWGLILVFVGMGLPLTMAWAGDGSGKYPSSSAEGYSRSEFVEEVDFYGRGPREARDRCMDGQDRDWRCRRGDHPYECSRCYEIDYNNYAYEVMAERGGRRYDDRGRGGGRHGGGRNDGRGNGGGDWVRPKNLYFAHWKPHQSWPFCTERATLDQICQMNGYDGYAGNVTTRHSGQGCARWNGSGWNKWEHEKTAVDQIQCYRGGGRQSGRPAPPPPPTSRRPMQQPAGEWVEAGNQHFGNWKPQNWPYCPDNKTLTRICKVKGFARYAGQHRTKSAGHGCTRWNGSGWNARREQNAGVAQILCAR